MLIFCPRKPNGPQNRSSWIGESITCCGAGGTQSFRNTSASLSHHIAWPLAYRIIYVCVGSVYSGNCHFRPAIARKENCFETFSYGSPMFATYLAKHMIRFITKSMHKYLGVEICSTIPVEFVHRFAKCSDVRKHPDIFSSTTGRWWHVATEASCFNVCCPVSPRSQTGVGEKEIVDGDKLSNLCRKCG